MSADDETFEPNSIPSLNVDELKKISKMAALRAKLLDMSKPELTKFMADIALGKCKEFCYDLIVFGISSSTGKDDEGYGNNNDSVLLQLREDEEDLGFSETLTEGFEVTKKVWRKALADALKGTE